MTEKIDQENPDNFLQITQVLDDETDRGLSVLVGAHLDFLLQVLISKSLVLSEEVQKFLFEGATAGLGTFESKIRMAEILDIIDQEQLKDLRIIQRVRNKFAHKLLGITFDTQDIKNQCSEMSFTSKTKDKLNPKEIFKRTSVRLIVDLSLEYGKE